MQTGYSNATAYSIKEVSSLIGLSPTTLRNIEAFFSIAIERNTAGQRLYTENIVNIFKKIKKYTTEGLQYADIKPLINIEVEGYSNTTPYQEIITDDSSQEARKFDLVVKPYTDRITLLETKTEKLTERNLTLERDNATLTERVNNKEDIINALSERLQKYEARKWWQVWK
jgi:DNA-binding transcriptional MerR regulator